MADTTPSKILSRRDFLKAAGIATGSALLAACAPSAANLEPPDTPTRPPDTTAMPTTTDIVSTESSITNFKKEIDPDTNIEVFTNPDGSPLNETQFNNWVNEKKQSGEYIKDPEIRTCAILIGDRAWKKWSTTGILNGEKVLPYLARHRDKLTDVFANQTRKSSGIDTLSFKPIVVIVDENFITGKNDVYRQFSQGETFGRWSWDSTYTPETFTGINLNDSDKKLYDDNWFHEMMHYSFFNPFHLWNYYDINSPNWNELLLPNYTIPGNITDLKGWENDESLTGLETEMLQNLQLLLNNGGGHSLSEPEELWIRKACLSSNPPTNKHDSGRLNKELLIDDLSPNYAFTDLPPNVPGVTLFKTTKLQANPADNIGWFLDSSAVKIDLPVMEGKVQIPYDFISTLPTDLGTGTLADISNAFVLLVDGQFIAFTNHHLAFWHYKEQLKHGETYLGNSGKPYPVEVSINEWQNKVI